MLQLVNAISILASFVFGTGFIYVLLDFTVGRLRFLNLSFEWNGLQIKDFVFLGIGVFIVLFFATFVVPFPGVN